jgi:hypothetical protein
VRRTCSSSAPEAMPRASDVRQLPSRTNMRYPPRSPRSRKTTEAPHPQGFRSDGENLASRKPLDPRALFRCRDGRASVSPRY